MTMIELLVLMGIIYLFFEIMDKFGGYILVGIFTILIIISLPYIFNFIKWFFTGFGVIITKPAYWITGIEVHLVWWFWLIFFVFALIPIITVFRGGTNRQAIL